MTGVSLFTDFPPASHGRKSIFQSTCGFGTVGNANILAVAQVLVQVKKRKLQKYKSHLIAIKLLSI
jgi:hypothetical protein